MIEKYRKMTKIFLFITLPIWILPYLIWEIIKMTWEEISEYVDMKEFEQKKKRIE